MKLIKQVTLHFQQGRSDKIYEVDLCEVGPDRFVVNFRYGRRGTTLRDGTKTVAPVSREQADAIYQQLVQSKTSKGYQPLGASPAASGPAAVTAAVDPAPPDEMPVNTARQQAILKRIAAGHDGPRSWPLSRAVWRAGQLRLREAEGLLPKLVGTGGSMLDYCIAWTLGRCGGDSSIPVLRQLQANADLPYTVRRMAADALLQLLEGERRQRAVEGYIAQLPEQLADLSRHGPAQAFQDALQQHLDEGDYRAYSALDLIYLIDNEHVRPALLQLLKTAPLQPNYFQRIRHIFKAAEFRSDAEVFGIIARRFEIERPFHMMPDWYYRGQEKPTQGKEAKQAFSRGTKIYMRNRVWRTLHQLGSDENPDYVRMAVGVLLPFTDEDAQSPQVDVHYRWNWRQRTMETSETHWDAYGQFWSLNHILYHNSGRYLAIRNKGFQCIAPFKPGDPEPEQLEAAFPHLWRRQPTGLLHLLDESRCLEVHKFAVKTLKQCPDFCQTLDVDALQMLLRAPYELTAEFGLELAVARYDPNRPDLQLVTALANCVLQRGRQQAHRWIAAQEQRFLEDDEFLVSLVSSPYQDTRQVARNLLRSALIGDTRAQSLIARIIAQLLTLGSEEGPLAEDMADILLRFFARPLRSIGADVIRDLLAHPLAQVQQLGGELLLNHETLSQQPAPDLLQQLLGASDPSVRAIGMRVIDRLPDHVLKRNVALLVALTTHAEEDVRADARPIVQRLSAMDSTFGREIAQALLQCLLTPGAPSGVPTHTSRVLREDLRRYLSGISEDLIWQLLQSRSAPAQQLGGALLADQVTADQLNIQQIVKLASHDTLTVREAAWKMFAASLPRLRAGMATAVKILDAKWEDSRQFAFQFFRDHFTQSDYSPALLVSICDSVREDVQQFARGLITENFQSQDGHEYLLKLSEHPQASLQLFATNFLDGYAADNPQRLRELSPYFMSVLSKVNRGRVAKDRVLALLLREAMNSREAAEVVAPILARQSATCAVGDKATMIELMTQMHKAYPDIPLPIKIHAVEVRSGV